MQDTTPSQDKAAESHRLIHLILIDRNEIMRYGIRTILMQTTEFHILCEAATPESLPASQPGDIADIIIWAIGPDETNLLSIQQQLAQRFPNAKLMLLASGIEEQTLLTISQTTGASCLMKDVKATELIQSLRMLNTGTQVIFSSCSTFPFEKITQRSDSEMTTDFGSLTKKERKLVEMIALGHTNKEIAITMNVSEKTIKNYISRIFDKLHVTRRSQVAALFGAGKI
ncbi:MAG: putative transcriptional regulator, LuxR family protein [Nitrospirales bacterium]|nr:MAG: putative transcriptional regulator, LuxR family protein [Nitrospirales bacterium]